MDKRTKEGREQEIIDYVNSNGGFSIFWITDNQKRAAAAMRLQNNGILVVTPHIYPWSYARIEKPQNPKTPGL